MTTMGFTFLSVALLLILGTTLGYDYESEDDCDGQVENFADLYDCRSYYECREDGEAVHSTCEDSFFDEERGICDPLLDEDDCIWRPVQPPPPPKRFPKKVVAMYLILADDSARPGVGTHSNWTPSLYKYQQQGANVLIFSFINPSIMVVPESFKKLASTRGKATRGAVPESTLIIFSIGGEGYSQKFKPWKWLTSKKRAEDMAERVSLWPDLYGCDGVEVNIESGAGNEKGAQKHLLDFIKKLRELSPDIIISQPTFGFPQVPAILSVINASWKRGRRSMNLADSVGLMVYHSSDSSDWVDHYFKGSKKGFLEVDVPEPQIMVGVSGTASAEDINALARDVFDRNLLGLMVWSGSVRGGIAYGHDASQSRESQKAFVSVMKEFNEFND